MLFRSINGRKRKSPCEFLSLIVLSFICCLKFILVYVQELTYGYCCSLILLVDWWKSNGGGEALPLTKIARRIVGLCASASACERNWSTFERVSGQVSFGYFSFQYSSN